MKSFRISLLLLFAAPAVSAFVAPFLKREKSSSTFIGSTTESPATLEENPTIAESQCEAGGSILDEAAMIQAQNFPIAPEALVELAKAALIKDSGVLDPSLWADDFEFCAPYVGPLSKEAFLDAADGFGIYEAFPDFDNRYFGFTVDPVEPGRVWFMTRLKCTNDGAGLFGRKEPTNKSVVLPPQMYSFKFNTDGKIRELTVGYAVDRRQGTTGGLGGMFGVFYGIGQGLPFPEGKPYQLSRRFRLFTKIGNIVSGLSKKEEE